MGSRYFGDQKPQRANVLAGGGRGREIRDLRKDVETAFLRLEEQTQTGWNDLQGGVTAGKANLALVEEAYRDTPALYSFLRHDRANTLTFTYQMSHSWLVGTDVRPHVHLIPMAAPAPPGTLQTVRFSGYYAWSRPERAGQLPALVSWTPFSVERAFDDSDQYEERIISGGLITPPSWAHWSSHLHIQWLNDTSHLNYTYKTNKDHGTGAANLLLLSFDTHIQVDSFGSQPEFPT